MLVAKPDQVRPSQKKIEQWRSFVLAYEVQLLDPDYLAKCASFANLVMAWLVRLVDPKKQHPHVRIECVPVSLRSCKLELMGRLLRSLPLPSETPLAFRMLPEFLIEDITEFLSFTSK